MKYLCLLSRSDKNSKACVRLYSPDVNSEFVVYDYLDSIYTGFMRHRISWTPCFDDQFFHRALIEVELPDSFSFESYNLTPFENVYLTPFLYSRCHSDFLEFFRSQAKFVQAFYIDGFPVYRTSRHAWSFVSFSEIV